MEQKLRNEAVTKADICETPRGSLQEGALSDTVTRRTSLKAEDLNRSWVTKVLNAVTKGWVSSGAKLIVQLCLQPTIFSDLTALQVHVAATGGCSLSPSQSRGLLALHLRTAQFLSVTVSSSQALPHSDSQHVFLDPWRRVSDSHLTLQHSVTSLPGPAFDLWFCVLYSTYRGGGGAWEVGDYLLFS